MVVAGVNLNKNTAKRAAITQTSPPNTAYLDYCIYLYTGKCKQGYASDVKMLAVIATLSLWLRHLRYYLIRQYWFIRGCLLLHFSACGAPLLPGLLELINLRSQPTGLCQIRTDQINAKYLGFVYATANRIIKLLRSWSGDSLNTAIVACQWLACCLPNLCCISPARLRLYSPFTPQNAIFWQSQK